MNLDFRNSLPKPQMEVTTRCLMICQRERPTPTLVMSRIMVLYPFKNLIRLIKFISIQKPNSIDKVSKSWSNIVQTPPPPEVVFDYCPLPPGVTVVCPPVKVLQKGVDKFNCSVVGTFTKGTLPFQRVSEITKNAWGSRGLDCVYKKESNQFNFKFNTKVEMNGILARGTWYFDRSNLCL